MSFPHPNVTRPPHDMQDAFSPRSRIRIKKVPRLIAASDAHEVSITRSLNNTFDRTADTPNTLDTPNAPDKAPTVLPGQAGPLNTPVPPTTRPPLVIHTTTKRQPADTPVPAAKPRVVIPATIKLQPADTQKYPQRHSPIVLSGVLFGSIVV